MNHPGPRLHGEANSINCLDLHGVTWSRLLEMCTREEKGPAEILLHGPIGVGKSVLLKRLYWELFDHQDIEAPILISIPPVFFEPKSWIRRFFMELARQWVAFELRDERILQGGLPPLNDLTNLCYDVRLYALVDCLKNLWREDMPNGDGAYLIEWAFQTLSSVVDQSGRRMTLMLDDTENARWVENDRQRFLSRLVPPLEERGTLRRIWTSRFAESSTHPELPPLPPARELLELEGLSMSEASQYFARLSRELTIDYDRNILADYLPLWGNIPQWLHNFARRAARYPRMLSAADHFIQPYVEDIQEGLSNQQLIDGLQQKISIDGPYDPQWIGRVAHECLYWEHTGYRGRGSVGRVNEREEKVLKALAGAGLAQYRQGRWEAPDVPVLTDFLRLFIARHHRGENILRSQIALKRKRLVETPKRASRRQTDQRVKHMVALMHTFHEQHVPKHLFHQEEGAADGAMSLEDMVAQGSQAAGLVNARKGKAIRLPHCIGAFPADDVLPLRSNESKNPAVVGWCFEGPECYRSEEALWVAHLCDAVTVTSEDIEKMNRVNGLLAREFDVRRVVGWVISDGRFSPESLERLEALHFFSSSWHDCEDLGEMLLSKSGSKSMNALRTPKTNAAQEKNAESASASSEKNESPPKEKPEVEIPSRSARILNARPEPARGNGVELYLPPEADMELVAAGTLEKLALRCGFDSTSIGQMKMAVLEACLNAIERSHNSEKMVRVYFDNDDENFIILIENEGVTFDPQMVEEPSLEKKVGQANKRGWGLHLMRKFMDKVTFEPFERGTRLRLEKRLPLAVTNSAEGKG
ncbi:MAG: ATP-binding protein [Candidatus Sumerlaeota bacterium]